MCDFGEMKRPDYKVGTVRSKGDARLSKGFYIESTQRLASKGKDLGLFYLLHRSCSTLISTIVVYDGPELCNIWHWAQGFSANMRKTVVCLPL